jgi:MFS transporter, DHA2 family, multidrug resistance protein
VWPDSIAVSAVEGHPNMTTLPVSFQAPPPSGATHVATPAARTWLLLGLGLATGAEFYTNDAMNLVLPDITGTLGVSFDQGSWLLTVYSCFLFLGVPVSVWMAAHVGYKRFLIACVLIFALTSVGCAVSPDLSTFLAWRALQGLAAGGLYVWWRASIYVLLPKSDRSISLMRVSTVLYLSSAAGMLVGGYVTDEFNWRLMFLPNLLYAAGACWLLFRHFPPVARAADPRSSETDGVGIALLAVTLLSLQIILSRGTIDDWFSSSFIQALGWTSVVGLVLFAFWQASPQNRAPLLRIDLLRDRYVVSSALIGVFTGIILSASLFALPEFLRNVDPEPHSATHTGRLMSVYALTAAAIRPLVVPLVARIGQRKTIVIALAMLIASMLLLSRLITTGTPDSAFVFPLILYAFCLSPLLPAVGSGTVARVEQTKLLDGVSLYMTFRQLGAAVGVALVTILINWRETLHSARLFEHLRTASGTTSTWLDRMTGVLATRSGYSTLESQHAALRLLADFGARQAATLAYADAFLFMAAVGVVALCVVPIIPPTPVARRP